MTALRRDGTKEFYQIQCSYKKEKPFASNWFLDFLEFTRPSDYGWPDTGSKLCHAKYSASGNCWQETGHHGTYDREWGYKLLALVREKYPDHDFRLVKMRVGQTTILCPER